jgi:hypothetical protein
VPQVQNLSRQIQLLLREQVQSRTGRALPVRGTQNPTIPYPTPPLPHPRRLACKFCVPQPSDESNGALVVASSTALSTYIADDLITFRDIQELQARG